MLDIDILNHLSQLLAGKITMKAFQEWFTPATWGIANQVGSRAYELTGTVELAFAEYSAGHLEYEELREELLSLLRNITIEFPPVASNEEVRTGATGVLISPGFFFICITLNGIRVRRLSSKTTLNQ